MMNVSYRNGEINTNGRQAKFRVGVHLNELGWLWLMITQGLNASITKTGILLVCASLRLDSFFFISCPGTCRMDQMNLTVLAKQHL